MTGSPISVRSVSPTVSGNSRGCSAAEAPPPNDRHCRKSGGEDLSIAPCRDHQTRETRAVLTRCTDMTSTKRRAAEAHAEVQFATRDCSLGRVLVATRGHGVCAILLGDNAKTLKRELRSRFPEECLTEGT